MGGKNGKGVNKVKERNKMKTKISIFAVWLLFIFTLYSICSAQTGEIIETREVFEDGSVLIRFATENGTIISEGLVYDNIELYDFSYLDGNDNLLNTFGDDYLETTIWVPNELGGCLPTSVCYNSNNNKYYFYGGRRIIIVDGDTNEILDTINISETGNIGSDSHIELLTIQRRLVYNPTENKIYCITDGGELIEINGNTNDMNVIYQIQDPQKFAFGNLHYNQNTNKVFCVINEFDIYEGWNGVIKEYDCNNQVFSCQIEYPIRINDITTTHVGNKVYISFSDGVKILDASDLSLIAEHNDIHAGAMVYNSNANELYVACGNKIAVIDGITNELLPYINVSSGNNLIEYNPVNNKIYCYSGGYIRIIDKVSGHQIAGYNIPHAMSLLYNYTDNTIFCGGADLILMINGETDELTGSTNLIGCHCKQLCYNSLNNIVCSANQIEGTVDIIDNNCSLIDSLQIGGGVYPGCYNSMNNKVYYIQWFSGYENSFVSIIDGETNQVIQSIPIGSKLSACTYNSLNNKIYVASYYDNKVIVIDGASDTIIDTITTTPYLYSLFSGPGDSIYCGCGNGGNGGRIHVINGESDIVTNNYFVDGRPSDFTFNTIDQKIYACLEYNNQVVVIDREDNIYEIPVGVTPVKMAYNPDDNKVYCINYDDCTVSIIDGLDNYVINTLPTPPIPQQVVYSSISNKIYINGIISYINADQTKIHVIDGKENEIIKTIVLDGYGSSLAYNPYNNNIYIHNLYDKLHNREMFINSIYCRTDEICSIISLEQHQKIGIIWLPKYGGGMVYNSENNNIYTGNCGFSNVSAIKCREPIYSGPVWYVSPEGDDNNDGSEEFPFATIQKGIDVAIDDDTVLVLPGIYNENIHFNEENITVASLFLITGDDISNAVIDGGGVGNVVTFSANCSPILAGFTIRNSGTNFAGIFCDMSHPTISNNILTENSIGIHCAKIDLIFQLILIYNTISNNDVGIYCSDSSPYIINNIIWGNSESFSFHPDYPSNPIISYSCIEGGFPEQGTDEGGNIYIDPLFAGAAVYNYSLTWNNTVRSPCIDTGNPGTEWDADETPPDMGAVPAISHNYDSRTLHEGWNWFSFPVLDTLTEQADTALAVLAPILDNMEEVLFENRRVIWWNVDHWENDIGDFRSVDGYKIQMNTPDTLPISGFLEDPDAVITLDTEAEYGNWIGYFIEPSMKPQDAFSQVWDKLTYIKAQNWTILFDKQQQAQPPAICPTVDYGKSYVVGVSEDCSFTWGLPLAPAEPYEKPETVVFDYQEKADYMPIFVDSTEAVAGIDEIGVFLDDECIGASVVEGFPVFVPAYIEDEDSTGTKDYGELTFQVATYSRNDKRGIPVFVYNEMKDAFVQEPIILDNKSYAIVRLGTGAGIEFPKEFTLYQNYPNPITNSTTISFIPSPGVEKSEIKMYNIKGQLVRTLTLMTNDKSPMTKVIWDGKDDNGRQVGNGIYFYKVISGKKSAIKKMVLMH